jgi:phosphoserine phosphatase RsbU/P
VHVLIAEDSVGVAASLAGALRSWGYIVTTAGVAGAASLDGDIPIVLIDWSACGIHDGARSAQIRAWSDAGFAQIVLLASAGDRGLAEGLAAGAADYVQLPVDEIDLRARLALAGRRLERARQHAQQVQALELATSLRPVLPSRLPICAYCKSIRGQDNEWHDIETYIAKEAHVQFSHGVCPNCVGVARAAMDEGLKS